MNKKIEYYSTDKVYKMRKRKLTKLGLLVFSILPTIILFIATYISFEESVTINRNNIVNYSEKGNVDYKVYLKDNNYYDKSYLDSGMQYIASLIKTINVKFAYEMSTTEQINLNNHYKVEGELIITENGNSSKVLLRKKENLVDDKVIDVKSDKVSISEEIDIDYDKYTNIVKSYEKDLGVIVSSNLVVKLETKTDATIDESSDKLSKDNKLQIVIPLSESTVNIKMNTENISNNGTIGRIYSIFKISNESLFTVFVFLLIISIVGVILDIYMLIKYFRNDIYKSTVNKILRKYDKVIVTGRVSINEDNYSNKVYPVTFEEMVDAAKNLEVPIMYYEPIPDEKSFFIVVKDDTIYKYRLTRAFLERNPDNIRKQTNESFYKKETNNVENSEEDIVPIMEDEDYEKEENIEDLTIKILQKDLKVEEKKSSSKKKTTTRKTKKADDKSKESKTTTRKKTSTKKKTPKKEVKTKE